MDAAEYDPFARGPFLVGVRTFQAADRARGRLFPCEIWYPAAAGRADRPAEPEAGRDAAADRGPHPLVIYSHHSGGNRRKATFLCAHLASHGYAVAALDHTEVVAPELGRPDTETDAGRAARIDAIIASRVPDVRFLLDHLLGAAGAGRAGTEPAWIGLNADRIGLVGHSFGGWTVLATPDVEPRVGAIVALAPAGSSRPKPGLLPLRLAFGWGRGVPTLYLAADRDTVVPPDGVRELFGRTPAAKQMFVLRRADHQHFVDDVEGEHEAVRAMSFPGEAAWIPAAMLPMTELCPGEQAHAFTRSLTLAHLDAALRRHDGARMFLDGDVEAALAAHGIDAVAHRP